MSRFRRGGEAMERAKERRRREDEAPRLQTQIPGLESLRLELEQRRGDMSVAESAHSKLVVVASAPALFEFPCREPSCSEGVYDLTGAVMRSLREGRQEFEGECRCNGTVGGNSCTRILRFSGAAAYR